MNIMANDGLISLFGQIRQLLPQEPYIIIVLAYNVFIYSVCYKLGSLFRVQQTMCAKLFHHNQPIWSSPALASDPIRFW